MRARLSAALVVALATAPSACGDDSSGTDTSTDTDDGSDGSGDGADGGGSGDGADGSGGSSDGGTDDSENSSDDDGTGGSGGSSDDDGTGGSGGSSSNGSTEDTGASSSDGGGELPDFTVETHVLDYGADPAQDLTLWVAEPLPGEPAFPQPHPTVVLAHGGLWQSGDKMALQTLCVAIVESSAGVNACASINYRLSQDLGGVCSGTGVDTYTEQLRDFAAAYGSLQDVSATHGLDPARMFVGGHSAGAHLAHELNLRWPDFSQGCDLADCPPPLGAIGFEGIYDIAAWDAYDEAHWGHQFNCATRKAFGAPASDPPACQDQQYGQDCWDIGSPEYLAENAQALGLSPEGAALIIHSPGDDWVDIAGATSFGAALSAAFPGLLVSTVADGTCAAGQHNDVLQEPALAACIVDFMAS
jgi:acetyl esterase/lipase